MAKLGCLGRFRVVFANSIYSRRGLPEWVNDAFGWILQSVHRRASKKARIGEPISPLFDSGSWRTAQSILLAQVLETFSARLDDYTKVAWVSASFSLSTRHDRQIRDR